MQLRPYQQNIVKQTINSDKSTLIQVPTGGGKTVIAKEIISDLVGRFDKQVLFVAPKIILMEQTAKVFKSLNPQIVHGFKQYDKNHKVLISTIQTAHKRDINPDVIIIDEIHYGFEGKMIERLIKDKPNTRVIGLSATPYDKNGEQLEGFDLVLDEYDMKYMVENKFLVDIKSYELVKIRKLEDIQVIGGDYNLKELGKIVCNNKTVLEIVRSTLEYIVKYKKTIVFAVDINHAELLTKAYNNEGFTTKALHSKLTKEDIAIEIKRFKEGQTKILVSVLMLTTGFDVPDVDVAVIARPTKSQNLYKQMVGRVLRLAKDKTHAILLDCGNVIENLGLPLEPIKAIKTNEINNKQKCVKCHSEKIKLKVINHQSFWVCKSCGHKEAIEQGTYECKICNKLYTHNAKFIIKNNKLFLNCEFCPYPTLISEYTGQEKLIEVDEKQYKKIDTKKSLTTILEERKVKKQLEKEEEKTILFTEKLKKDLSNKLTKRLWDKLKSVDLNLDEFRKYIINDEFIEDIKEFKKRIFKQLEVSHINIINKSINFDELTKKVREGVYGNFINTMYKNELNGYIIHLFTSSKQGMTDEEFKKFQLSKKQYKGIKEKKENLLKEYTDKERNMIDIKPSINIGCFIDGKFWTISITLKD